MQGDKFRSIAFSRAATALATRLEACGTDEVAVSVTELEELKSVGARSVARLIAMQESSDGITLPELEETKTSAQARSFTSYSFICSVHGFGPARASQLAANYAGRIQNIKHLDAIADAENFTHAQRLGIKYFQDAQQRIPRAEMLQHDKVLGDIVKEMDPPLTYAICGSFRRGLATSGDIDCLLSRASGRTAPPPPADKTRRTSGPKGKKLAAKQPSKARHGGVDDTQAEGQLASLVKRLDTSGYVVDTLALGPTKFMGYARLPASGKERPVRRLDVRWVQPEEHATALLYFTGSAAFNTRMRSAAHAAGYMLNEYGLFKLPGTKPSDSVKESTRAKPETRALASGGRRMPLTSEADIFKAIGMTYVEPSDRE
jgi:DNA polymerase beta